MVPGGQGRRVSGDGRAGTDAQDRGGRTGRRGGNSERECCRILNADAGRVGQERVSHDLVDYFGSVGERLGGDEAQVGHLCDALKRGI